jgi:hypothetical protein
MTPYSLYCTPSAEMNIIVIYLPLAQVKLSRTRTCRNYFNEPAYDADLLRRRFQSESICFGGFEALPSFGAVLAASCAGIPSFGLEVSVWPAGGIFKSGWSGGGEIFRPLWATSPDVATPSAPFSGFGLCAALRA